MITHATCHRYATCRLNALGADPAYASVRVRPARGNADDDIGGGGATASSLSFAEGLPVLGRRSGKRAPEHALAALRAHEAARASDRAWHASLVRGAISQLLGAIGVEHPAEPVIGGAPRGGIVGLEASAAGVERGSRRGGAVLAVPFDCVDPDYVEHNRMLLPGARFPASCHVAEWRHGAESAHAGGARSLRERVARLREAAEAAHCADANGAAGFDLHPSGFTSMLSSAIKPWTLALRLGRALFTPRSAAIFDGARCKRRDLGCIFEPIGPACETERPSPAVISLNLPQQMRESLSTGGVSPIPAEWRGLGHFWWTAHLLRLLARPSARLRARVAEEMRSSGLRAAVDGGTPVIGMHVRHGDSCIAAEAARTKRACEPLSAYVDAITPFAEAHGARTIYLATDSVAVRAQAAAYAGRFTIVGVGNLTRSSSVPTAVIDEVIKRRAKEGGVAKSHRLAEEVPLEMPRCCCCCCGGGGGA